MLSHPESFGRYELLRRVARGGMGEVFLARLQGPAGFEKLLVIKRVLSELADRSDFVEMFFAEARLAAKLNHRNIVQIFDMGEVDGSYYIAMEHVHGKNLADLLIRARSRGERVPGALVIDVVCQVCDGLAYAHAVSDRSGPLHLIHRDINPRNIIVSYSGEAKIIDFGIAKSSMQIEPTAAGVIKGKLAYMSPEQSTARPLDRRSDIFSVGICLYELCSFEHPFWRGDRVMTFDAIQRREPKPLAEYGSSLAPFDEVVGRALAKAPAERYPDCHAMRHDLQRLLLDGRVAMDEQTLANYMHLLFAKEIAAEDELLREVTGPAYFGEVDPDATDPDRSTWLGITGRLITLSRGVWRRVGIVRPPVAIMIAGIGLLGGYGSLSMYLLGQRHAAAAATSVVETTPALEVAARLSRAGSPAEDSPLLDSAATAAPPAGALTLVDDSGRSDGAERAPPTGAARDTTPAASTSVGAGAATEPRPVRSKRRRSRAAVRGRDDTLGMLSISSHPNVRIMRAGQRVSGAIAPTAAKGRVVVGSGKDAQRDPFRVVVIYNIGPRGIAYRIDSMPWAIVQDGIGAGLGRTPINVSGGGKPLTIELNNPVGERSLHLVLDYRP